MNLQNKKRNQQEQQTRVDKISQLNKIDHLLSVKVVN